MPHGPRRNSWFEKFRCAGRGVVWAMRTQRSFAVHLAATAIVAVAAIVLQTSLIESCLLTLCVVAVLAAELFNTALEHLARAVSLEDHDDLRDALDVSSGAVLLASLGAGVVGALIFAHRLGFWSSTGN